MKALATLAALAALLCPAAAQQRTFYDSSGRVAGHAAIDSQGTTTFYDAAGNVAARASKGGETATPRREHANCATAARKC